MAKKFFSKILDAIGIEETSMEDEYDEYEEYDDFEGDEAEMAEEYEPEEEVLKYSNRKSKRNINNNKVVDLPSSAAMRMVVYQPNSYDDTQNIIDFLKARKPVVVNLEMLEIDVAQRVLDFISGAIYSLNGSIHKVSKGIFILAPMSVDITGNVGDAMGASNFYNLGRQPR